MVSDPKPIGSGILSPVLDWTPEQRAAVQPKLDAEEFEMLVRELHTSGHLVLSDPKRMH